MQGLLGVAGKGEGDQPAIAVALGAQPFEPQRAPGDQRLQARRGCQSPTSIAASRNSRPSASISVRPSRTAATFAVPIAVSLQRSCAAALHTKQRAARRPEAIDKIAARASFHDGGRLPEFATMPDNHKRHCDRRGGDQCRSHASKIAERFCSPPRPRAYSLRPARAAQTAWPDHTVKIIIPYPAGGSTDVLSRILAEHLKEIFGQTFVIENRPGAGGNIGIAAVTGSAPDGYTIGAATIGHFAINQFLYSKMPYDPERDMIPASLTWELPNVFVVATDHVPGQDHGRVPRLGEAEGQDQLRQPRRRHLAASVRRIVCQTHRPRRRACAVPRRGADHPRHAVGRREFRASTISTSYMSTIAVRKDARAGGHLGAALADHAGRADHGGGGLEGFRRHLVGGLRVAGRHAAPDRRQTVRRHEEDRGRPGAAEALPGGRRAQHVRTPEEAIAYAAKERAMWKDVVGAVGRQAAVAAGCIARAPCAKSRRTVP